MFVDEAHKLANASDSDTRSITEYNAIDLTLERYPNLQIIFSAPNINNPEVFLKLFGKKANYSKTITEAPVAQNLYLIDLNKKEIRYFTEESETDIDSDFIKKIISKNEFIYEVGKHQHSNMIYCSSPDKAVKNAKDLYENFVPKNRDVSKDIEKAIKQIESYVHNDYYLVRFLKKKIAYHHGRLPQLVRNIIEELFRIGEIDFIFCTPTLIEGINMPTKNIFINYDPKISLKGDKKKHPDKTLTFWNLAGRAGRYRQELSGNIFCIQDDECWVNTTIFTQKDVILKPSIEKRLDTHSKLRKLEAALKHKNTNKQILHEAVEYLANIICIDTLRFNKQIENSFVLSAFAKANMNQIIELARERANTIEGIDFSIINSYKSLNFEIQKKLYNMIKVDPRKYILPTFTYENCLTVLKNFYNYYDFDIREKDFKSIPQLAHYGFIMFNWISGKPVSQIIKNTLNHYEENNKDVYLGRDRQGNHIKESFERNNIEHVNHLIEDIFKKIEKILRFTLERYFNHYHKILTSFLGEEDAGQNWATLLEYGSTYPIVIALQNIGLSRYTANTLYKNRKYRECLLIEKETGFFKGFNKEKLLTLLDEDSLEYKEILKVI